jgi:membrane protein DedA with SNARE-associated domain
MRERMSSPLGLGYLVGLFGVVVTGAVIPVVPTGAAVSVAGALADQDNVVLILLVIAFGAAGAYVGDLGTYAVLRILGTHVSRAPGRISRWLHRRRQGAALERVQAQLEQHQLRTLLLSRLVPGGQIPVLLAAALGGYSWTRYAVGDIAATIVWSTMYTATGIAGRAVFPKPWEGAVAGIALVLLVSLAGNLCNRRQSKPGTASPVPIGHEA